MRALPELPGLELPRRRLFVRSPCASIGRADVTLTRRRQRSVLLLLLSSSSSSSSLLRVGLVIALWWNGPACGSGRRQTRLVLTGLPPRRAVVVCFELVRVLFSGVCFCLFSFVVVSFRCAVVVSFLLLSRCSRKVGEPNCACACCCCCGAYSLLPLVVVVIAWSPRRSSVSTE